MNGLRAGKKNILIIILLILTISLQALIIRKGDFSKGPLYGKNMYIPFFIYYNMPGISAKGGDKFQFEYHFSLYYLNDFKLKYLYVDEDENYTAEVLRDYESIVFELGASFYIVKNLQVGVDARIMGYYGGFLDTIIEGYHTAFGFPNAGREHIARNQIYIDIPNDNNVNLHLDRPAASIGDIDLWVKYTFFQIKWVSLAAFGALKVPTGRSCGISISGSGYPDFAVGVLADLRPFWLFTFYIQTCLVMPLDFLLYNIDSNPYPMFNGIFSVELNPFKFFSFIVQFNIKNSPLSGDIDYFLSGIGYVKYLQLPQVNLLIGLVFKYKNFRWQFYFEEDAFTNAGTDITFNISFSHTFKIKARF